MNDKRCSYCANYLNKIERCKYCHFEYDDDLPWTSDDWNILELDDDLEWSHHQILYRLWSKGIECLYADIWSDDLAYLIGVTQNKYTIAKALNISEDVIYEDPIHGWHIINLFEWKYKLGLLDE